jgi:hypothetical protein
VTRILVLIIIAIWEILLRTFDFIASKDCLNYLAFQYFALSMYNETRRSQ